MVLLVYLINFSFLPYARQEYHGSCTCAASALQILKILRIPDVIRINRLRRNLRQFVSVRSSLSMVLDNGSEHVAGAGSGIHPGNLRGGYDHPADHTC